MLICAIALFILCVVHGTNSLVLPGTMNLDIKARVSVEIISKDGQFRNRNRRTANPFPVTLPVRFPFDGQPMNFNLKKNDGISTKVPVYVLRNGVVTMERLHQDSESCLYQDLERGASFHVTVNTLDSGDNSYAFLGSFLSDQKEYLIHPLDSDDPRVNSNEASWNTTHQVVGPAQMTNFTSDFIYPDQTTKEVRDRKLSIPNHPRQKRATGTYTVELLFVIDYSVYSFWYSHHTGTASQRDSRAKESIRQFYSFVLNGMSTRYADASGSGFSIATVFAGIFIADSSTISYWTESTKTAFDTVDASTALDQFRTWITSQTGLPDHDHAMTSTAYDLTKDESTSNAGLAFQGTICSAHKQSIIEDHFKFSMITVAAHELGHSLGSVHDGEGNVCDANDGYVMTAVSSVKSGALVSNPWKFSTCSVSSFNQLINTLDSGPDNCLTSLSPGYDPDALVAYDGQYPGQVYSPDEQCQYTFGDMSYICRSFFSNGLSNICSSMACRNPSNPTSCNILYAGERTSCGDKKWCRSGICTSSNDAPALAETCPFGDQPGIYKNGLTCSEYIKSNRIQCTIETTRHMCCSSCQDAITGIPDCDYGDTASGCIASNCQFYDAATKALCCETCYDGPPITDAPDITTQKPVTTSAPTIKKTVTTSAPTTKKTVTTAAPTTQEVVTTAAPSTKTASERTTVPTVTTTKAPTFFDNIKDNIIIIAAAGGGGLALIILVVTCVCLCRKKKTPKPLIPAHRRSAKPSFRNGVDNPRFSHPHDRIAMVSGNPISHHPPLQTRLSRESQMSVGHPRPQGSVLPNRYPATNNVIQKERNGYIYFETQQPMTNLRSSSRIY